MPWPILLIVLIASVLVGRTMLRNFGIGISNGKPDCGCGSGSSCTTNSE